MFLSHLKTVYQMSIPIGGGLGFSYNKGSSIHILSYFIVQCISRLWYRLG